MQNERNDAMGTVRTLDYAPVSEKQRLAARLGWVSLCLAIPAVILAIVGPRLADWGTGRELGELVILAPTGVAAAIALLALALGLSGGHRWVAVCLSAPGVILPFVPFASRALQWGWLDSFAIPLFLATMGGAVINPLVFSWRYKGERPAMAALLINAMGIFVMSLV